ncbi:hypothetical protein ACHAXR_013147 [Thalassiosira sp. AJA248-18]
MMPTQKSKDAMERRKVGVQHFAGPSSLLLLLCVASSASICMSFTSPRGINCCKTHRRHIQKRILIQLPSSTSATAEDSAVSSSSTTTSLPNLYPDFANTLASNGYVTPTPIQQSSASLAKEGENLMLIAATGSGKTLAYLLPLLSNADASDKERVQRKTVLVVAPTRELAAQLVRDASVLVPDEINNDSDKIALPKVLLAVRGIPPPTPSQIAHATVLIGTPPELYAVLTRVSGAQNFVAGNTLSGLILDEVDVLLPPTPKKLRTSFDGGNDAQRERKTLEQRRKLRAAQRRGVEFHGGASIKGKSINSMDLSNSMNSQVLTPTERVLRLIGSARYVGEDDERLSLQVLAGSATASRATLDRLNKVLRWAATEGGVIGGEGLEGVWKGRMKVCRPEDGQDVVDVNQSPSNPSEEDDTESTHTIRAVTVPSAVDHRHVFIPKAQITNSQEILANVARVAHKLKPKTSLLFICGEFSRSLTKEKKKEFGSKATGKTSQSRRNAKRRSVFNEKKHSNAGNNGMKGSGGGSGAEPLSVRKACSVLQSMGVDARPMHVVLGLEPNAGEGWVTMPEEEEKEDGNVNIDGEEVELPPVLVTFEGSARGLHFDGVDIVFVVGRPTSAASYLHLAGRVGRAMAGAAGDAADESAEEVEVRPGTIVSFCSKGRVKELEKWTSQVGATGLEEIVL